VNVINNSGDVMSLRSLSLQNNRVGDKLAMSLVNALFLRTPLEDLNLAQNGLGFKTGQFILNFIASCCCHEKKHKLAIQAVNLGFNVMSDSLIERI
jgi:Ran GTPase-activating protein (RanGAP) involved in mRNA processing and transport